MIDSSHAIFDYALFNAHRDRAARMAPSGADYLWAEMAERLIDKLSDIKRSFPLVLDSAAHHGGLRALLNGRFGIESCIQAETSVALASKLAAPKVRVHSEILPYAANQFDAILSVGQLHAIGDLPGVLAQMHEALKPDGLLLAILPAGETLKELRFSLQAAMQETTGGVSARISPMIDVLDAASLMQRVGFSLPVVDREQLVVHYSSPLKLLTDLRAMGQTNALMMSPKTALTRGTLLRMIEIYQEHFRVADGGVAATFDLVTLTGWKADASQPKAKARGSATHSMRDWL